VRILTNSPLPEGKYDFTITQPRGKDEGLTNLLQQVLKSAFNLTGRKETRETEVLLLKVKEPNAKGLVVSPTPSGSFRSGPGVLEGMDISMKSIATALENGLKEPVIDETGLTNHYDVSLKWEEKSESKPNRTGLIKAVREQLGLELVPARRPVEMVLVEQVKPEARRDGS
jgi:uncharacterized protein (TIGR03435 family)